MIYAIITIAEEGLIGTINEDEHGFRIMGKCYSGDQHQDNRFKPHPVFSTFDEACQKVVKVVRDAKIMKVDLFQKNNKQIYNKPP